MDEQKPKKIIIPQKKYLAQTVSRVSTVSSMLEGALDTLGEQLDKLAIKSKHATFNEKEARVLQGYIKSLVDLSKEERERDKADKLNDELAKLSDTELLELAQQKLTQQKQELK